MQVHEIIKVINGNLLNQQVPLNKDVKGGCGADLMSDVLASIKPDAVLLTGLCNIQVVRTAQMADVCAIVFVRGKMPQPETVELATRENIPLITSPFGMFELCGRLYQAGLHSFESPVPNQENDRLS